MIALICAIYSGIILQFDGSLRNPSDPGFPTSSLGRIAACAACITVDGGGDDGSSGDDALILDNGRRLSVLAGKSLNAGITTTSGEVEYEGLLFGLTQLNQYVSDDERAHTGRSVLVQGDCRNVIDQMNGVARPRKLETYHEKCKCLVTNMSKYQFEFQHIPRTDNTIADRFAYRLVFRQQQNALKQLIHDMEQYTNNPRKLMEDGRICSLKSDPILPEFLAKHIGVSSESFIPFSIRPAIYHYVASFFFSVGDFQEILILGQWFQNEIEKEWRYTSTISSLGQQSIGAHEQYIRRRDASLEEAIAYQILALRSLQREDEALVRLKKNRVIARQKIDDMCDLLTSLLRVGIADNKLLELKETSKSLAPIGETADAVADWIEKRIQFDQLEQNLILLRQ